MKKQLIALLAVGSLSFINASSDEDTTPPVLQGEAQGAAESTQARIEEGARKAVGRTMFGRADTGAEESVSSLRSRFEQQSDQDVKRDSASIPLSERAGRKRMAALLERFERPSTEITPSQQALELQSELGQVGAYSAQTQQEGTQALQDITATQEATARGFVEPGPRGLESGEFARRRAAFGQARETITPEQRLEMRLRRAQRRSPQASEMATERPYSSVTLEQPTRSRVAPADRPGQGLF